MCIKKNKKGAYSNRSFLKIYIYFLIRFHFAENISYKNNQSNKC